MTGTFSYAERHGCKNILLLMSEDNLLSLHHTVTNKEARRIFTPDAIDEIISHSKAAEELLKRKKVQREIIFTYLQNQGLVVDKNFDKAKLVNQALTHWFRAQHRRPPQVSIQPDWGIRNIFPSVPANNSFDTNLRTAAQQFCQWFYGLLNSLNPVRGQVAERFPPQHFWEDVKLRLRSRTGIEEYEGAEQASQRLLALARDEMLLLSPNLEPHGLRALSSPHGLVLVAVAGTIHRDTACLGIYEQAFGLIRSPLNHNQWKIKFTEVRMSDELNVGNELGPPSLTWDASELQGLCS